MTKTVGVCFLIHFRCTKSLAMREGIRKVLAKHHVMPDLQLWGMFGASFF